MKFKSLFLLLLIISLATISFLVDIHPAYAARVRCTGSLCRIVQSNGYYRGGGTIPSDLLQKLNDQIIQKNFHEVERLLVQFSKQAEITQDINGQAAANQVLGDVYTIMSKPDLASSHLTNAGALYQRLGNAQSSSEVRVQLRQIQFQQLQRQQLKFQQR
jgi:hypothetical protein